MTDEDILQDKLTDSQSPFAPDGFLYAEVDDNHRLMIMNQLDAIAQNLPLVEYEKGYDGYLYEKGYAPEKPEEEIKRARIAELKALLDGTDYEVIKCSECSLAGVELPYDIAELHAQRQAIRDEINELEAA